MFIVYEQFRRADNPLRYLIVRLFVASIDCEIQETSSFTFQRDRRNVLTIISKVKSMPFLIIYLSTVYLSIFVLDVSCINTVIKSRKIYRNK